MKTHYEGHDGLYRRRKAAGTAGWDDSPDGYAKFQRQVTEALSHGHAPKGGRLLELGCGAGNMTLWFAEQGYEVYGVDIAPTAIEWAREQAAAQGVAAEFSVGSVVDLAEFESSFFDFVFDGHCLHCIIGDDRRALFASVHRVLKPGGYFLVQTAIAPDDPGQFEDYDPDTNCTFAELRRRDPDTGQTVMDRIATRYFGHPDDIVAEVGVSGLEVIRHRIEENDILTIETRKAGKAQPDAAAEARPAGGLR